MFLTRRVGLAEMAKIRSMGCPRCGKVMEYEVRQEDIDAREAGAFIQDAFPYLTADERESLMSGFCDEHFLQLPDPDDEW